MRVWPNVPWDRHTRAFVNYCRRQGDTVNYHKGELQVMGNGTFAKQGRVREYSEKPWTDKFTGNAITLYSFRIEDDNKYYRHGTEDPGCREGDFIQFVTDGNNNVEFNSIQKTEAPQSARPSPAQSAKTSGQRPQSKRTGSTGATSRDQYWADKEARDLEKDARYQSTDVPRMSFSAAQDRAVRLVAAALEHDALSFGSVAKGKKLDMLLDYVDQVTDRFFLQSIGAPERLVVLQDQPIETAQEPTQEDDLSNE